MNDILLRKSVFISAGMVALRTTAVNFSFVGEKPYDLVYGGLWKACLVKNKQESCQPLLVGQGMHQLFCR